MSRNAPPGHTPRFTAYSARFPRGAEAFVFAQYACQAPSADEAAGGATALAGLFAGPDGPDVLDRGSFTDTAVRPGRTDRTYWIAARSPTPP